MAEPLLTAPRAKVPHHGPVTSGCPVECLLTVLSVKSFNPLTRACDAPFGQPRTVGDVIDLSGTAEALPEARTAGTDDLTYSQLAAARKAARNLLDCGVLEPAEHASLTLVVQRISAAIDARPVDLDGAHQRWPDWRFSRDGGELVARSTDGLCTLRADSPEALEAEVRREKQMWASVRAFAARSHWQDRR